MKLLKVAAASAAVLGVASAVSSDDVREEKRDVDTFDKVAVHGSIDMEVKVGPSQSVTVIADGDIIEYVRTRVRGGELVVDLHDRERRSFRNIKELKVMVTMPEIHGGEVHGSGDLLVEDAESNDFDIEVHGSGDAVFTNGKFGRVNIEVQGSGDIKVEGSCEDARMQVQGSGDIEADDMECADAEASVHGSGDIKLFASKSAEVSVHGSGDIVVYGKPDQLRTKVRGSGDIHVR